MIPLYMIHSLQRADIEAVEDDLSFQLVPALLDMVVLHHDNHHVHIVEELIEIAELVFGYLLMLQEGVVALEGTGEVALLQFQHLESGRFTVVIHILFIG